MAATRLTSVVVLMMSIMLLSGAIDINKVRQFAAKYNGTCVLLFGDSSVDSSDNKRLDTTIKSNFLPYGKDIFGRPPYWKVQQWKTYHRLHRQIGYTKAIPAFLEPNLGQKDIVHVVSFASAASGYDGLTANLPSKGGFDGF